MGELFVLILMFERCYLFDCTVDNDVTLIRAASNEVSIFLPALRSHISVFQNHIFSHYWFGLFEYSASGEVSEFVAAQESFRPIAHQLCWSAWFELDACAELRRHLE